MKHKLIILAALLAALWTPAAAADAPGTSSVVITTDIAQTQDEQFLTGEVRITTTDIGLFHDGVRLSWHIFDQNGSDLVYENQRIPVAMGSDGVAVVPVEIDLAALGLASQKIFLRFDLVDEENLFWFSTNPGIALTQGEIACRICAPKVTLSCSDGAAFYGKKLETEVCIDFGDTGLYHEGIKLSWHIVDGEGQELLFENERIPIPSPTEGVSRAQVRIDLSQISAVSTEKALTIQFDLVDETNGYWYTQNPALEFQGAEVIYTYRFLPAFKATIMTAVQEQPVVFLVNLIVDAGAVIAVILIKKKRVI